jgi:hypothetical protein
MKSLSLTLLTLLTLHAPRAFAGTNTWVGDLDVGPEGVLLGGSNDLFRVGGSFNNQTTNTAYNILASTFEFTGTGAHNLEQFSRDLGPCAGNISNNWAFGTLKIDGGTVTIVDNFPNSSGPDAVYAQALTGSGTLNVGAGMKFYFGTTNGWSGTVNVTGGVFRQYLPDNIDSDGDGMVNSNECLCGTDPTSSTSVLRIISIAKEANDMRVTWTTVGGRSYVLQTNVPPASGSFTNNFSDFSSVIFVLGSGESTTNQLDLGGATNSPARYYRIRLVQ